MSPFPEHWKNLIPIDAKEVRAKMKREDVLAFLKKWEDRVKALGYRRNDSSELSEKEYSIMDTDEDFINMIHISMGPSRLATKGGQWSDGWSFSFTERGMVRILKTKPGKLISIGAFRDEFNSMGRK